MPNDQYQMEMLATLREIRDNQRALLEQVSAQRMLVEEQYRVSIPDEEVGKVAFASIDALADYILGHQGAGSA